METLIAFYYPRKNAYKLRNATEAFGEEVVSRLYERMAITGFDNAIKFRDDYGNYLEEVLKRTGRVDETIDFFTELNVKERIVTLTAFLDQPVESVGEGNAVEGPFTARSYIFSLNSKYGMLPLFEVVQLKGKNRGELRKALDKLAEEPYTNYGNWSHTIYAKEIEDNKIITPLTKGTRFEDDVKIINPEKLLEIAEREMEINLEQTSF